jgi:phosphatidylserine decarboxylase
MTVKNDRLSYKDFLKAWPQFLLPHFILCNIMHGIARIRIPVFKNALIRWFAKQYHVNLAEALHDSPTDYEHFNAFFTRPLKPQARPLAEEENAVVSPVDGTISQIGAIEEGRIIQAKGRSFSVLELIGGDTNLAAEFANGMFITIYLSPKDYHRIHMPLPGKASHMLYVPGRLFSVSAATTRVVNRLFARNERVATLFKNPAVGEFYTILVGALFVGSMETLWHGVISPPHSGFLKRWNYENDTSVNLSLVKGQEMGRFNMGSTVILLFKQGVMRWSDNLEAGVAVKMGQKLGDVTPS